MNGDTMQAPPRQGKPDLEIIVDGTLEYFLAFMRDVEDRCWENKDSPIEVPPPFHDGARVWWPVHKRGAKGLAGMIGAIEAMELPRARTRVVFKLYDFPAPDLFWQMVDKFVEELARLGFEPQPPLTGDEDSSLIKILFLAANPADRDRLRLDAEMRAIDLALQQAAFRDRFDITMHGAVRAADLRGYLLRHKPDIVHFSGHGDQSSEIVLEDSSGKSHPVSVRALSSLFSVFKDNIRCVVLNACYSEQQAKAIAEHIDCVIGMSKAIGDTAAISFAMAFYQALGYGRSVKTAFDLGCAQIDLENLGEQDTPKLLALNSDPKTVVFVHNSSK